MTKKEDYQKFFKQKLQKFQAKSINDLDTEAKKKFFNEIESEWKQQTNQSIVLNEANDYQKFFKNKLQKFQVGSINQLNTEEKKKFFNEIEQEWTEQTNQSIDVLNESGEYQKFFRKKLQEFEVSSFNELDVENKKKFFNEIQSGWKKQKPLNESKVFDSTALAKLTIVDKENLVMSKFINVPNDVALNTFFDNIFIQLKDTDQLNILIFSCNGSVYYHNELSNISQWTSKENLHVINVTPQILYIHEDVSTNGTKTDVFKELTAFTEYPILYDILPATSPVKSKRFIEFLTKTLDISLNIQEDDIKGQLSEKTDFDFDSISVLYNMFENIINLFGIEYVLKLININKKIDFPGYVLEAFANIDSSVVFIENNWDEALDNSEYPFSKQFTELNIGDWVAPFVQQSGSSIQSMDKALYLLVSGLRTIVDYKVQIQNYPDNTHDLFVLQLEQNYPFEKQMEVTIIDLEVWYSKYLIAILNNEFNYAELNNLTNVLTAKTYDEFKNPEKLEELSNVVEGALKSSRDINPDEIQDAIKINVDNFLKFIAVKSEVIYNANDFIF